MKVKDTSFLQQHLEKIILGAAVLFALVVLWFYGLGEPYGVNIANRENVAPSEVPDLLLVETAKLRASIESQKSPLPSMSVADYTEEFRARMARSLLPFDRYTTPLSRPGLDLRWGGSQAQSLDRLVIPTPPAPFDVQIVSSFGVLAEQPEPQLTQDILQLIGDQQPRDFRYVSVGATFDMAQWAKLIQQTPAGQRIPESWWNTRRLLTAVVLQRQQLDPATGQWSDPTTIAPLSTGRAYGAEAFQYTPAEAAQVLDLVYYEQEFVKRPPFPLMNRVWFPPGAQGRQLSPEDQRHLADLQREITGLQDRIRHMTRGEQEAANAPRSAPALNAPGRGPTAIDDLTRIDAAPRPAPTPRSAAGRPVAPTALERNQQRLAELQAEFNQLRGIEDAATPLVPGYDPALLRTPGINPEITHGIAPAFPDQSREGASPAAPDNERMTLWAHDLTIKPGQTYRYRVVAYVFNPLFQRKEVVPEQREEYFNQLALASTPSDWSSPVAIDPVVQFFVVRADPGDATIEVWRIHNGQWVHDRFRVRPGDPIGGAVTLTAADGSSTPIDLSVNALAVDLRLTSAPGGIATTHELLYYDPATHRLHARSAADLDSDTYIRLQAEAAQAPVAALP